LKSPKKVAPLVTSAGWRCNPSRGGPRSSRAEWPHGTSPSSARLARMAFLLRNPIDPAEARLVLSPAEAAVRAALAPPRRERRS